MTADILTVPDDRYALEERFRLLFPDAEGPQERRRPVMISLLDDHHCATLCDEPALATLARGQLHQLDERDAPPADQDRWTADRCGHCGRAVPWSDVTSGASMRLAKLYGDVRLCGFCTAERAR